MMPMRLHTHYFIGKTSENDGHRHDYNGFTSASPDTPGHTHHIAGQTSINDRHTHRYAFLSGPEKESDAGHTHFYRGVTGYADGHVHRMEGYTSVYRGGAQ
jgi:hypothetical protein